MEQSYKEDLRKIIPLEISGSLDFLFENKIITVVSARNYLIKHEFVELKKENKSSETIIRLELADKYFLSAEMVYHITKQL